MHSLFTTASNVVRRRHTQGIALPCLGFSTQIYIFHKVLTFFFTLHAHHIFLKLILQVGNLRVVVSNFRESGDRAENSNFFLFAQKNPFGELFSKIIFKSSSEFLFWQKNGKFEIGRNGPSDPM